MNSNYILLNYEVNWSDLPTNFLASPKYPVQPRLFDTGSRPPSWGGSFPECKGGMVTGHASSFTLGTHGGSLRAYPQPRQLPALCFSSCWGVEHMGFSHLIALPCLGFTSCKTFLLGLLQEEFVSWPISFCRHCSSSEVEISPEEVKDMPSGRTNPRKVRWRLSHCSQPG